MRSARYAWSLFKSFYEYNHRYTKLNVLPQISAIEATNMCNLRCTFCARPAIEKHRGLGFMPFARFKELVETYKDQIITPVLNMHGESTLHPDLPRMVRLVKDCGARSVSITTNGTLLNSKLFLELAEAGISGIEVSFEGTDKQNYERQRVGAHFEVVKQNILNACRLKIENNLNINLGINIIDNAITHDYLPQFFDEWSRVEGLNRIDSGKIIDWVGTLDPHTFKELLVEDTYSHPFSKFKVCPAPWFFVGINYNGWVVPCCHWLYAPFGNVFEQSLEQIWNGQKYVDFRKLMLSEKGRFNHPYCAKCWDGTMLTSSPYFHEPNHLFPFTKKFAANVKVYFSKVMRKTYRPTRETVKELTE
jgi:MoaA/NifB/PqqE/SkfB family radical SAM enzyme